MSFSFVDYRALMFNSVVFAVPFATGSEGS